MPVIASRTPGPEGIIRPGENGFLFDRDDAASLAEAMRRFVEDPRLLAAARAAASATVIRSVNEQVAQVESIYRELRSGASPHAVARLPRSVLFLAGMTGAPYRYRVAHLMQQLRALGIRATARFHHDEEALALAGEHEIVILNRVPWDIYVERIIRRARTAGALVVFGVDDLVFDPGLKIAALDGFSRKEVKIYRRGLRLFRRTLGACDALLGSTPALAEAARRIGKPAFVQPNTLDEELIRVSEAARVEAAEQRSRCQDALVRIGYFSGSNAHDGDFAVAARALARVLAARPRTCLVVGGHLQLPRALSHFRERIERLPFVPWRELPAFIAHIDINIAPLHTPSAFNDAKSALKWFEAAACGVPTIASPTASFRAAIRHGENGFLAENAAEWETALLSLVDDADLRTRIAEAARADALSEHGPARGTAHFAETLRQMLPLARLPLRALPKVTAAELDAVRARGISVGRAAFEPEDRIPGPSQPQWNGVTPNLTSTVSVYQALFFPDGLLTRIDFLIGTYGRIHRHDLVLRIIDPGSGIEVARSVVPAERACDNTWFSFDMGAVPTREGRQMLLVLEAPNAPRRRGPSIYCHHVGWPLGAGWAGAMHGFNLTYRTWFHPPDDAEADSNLAGKGEVSQPSAPAPSSAWAQQLEERLVLSENRLAHIGTQPSGLQAIAMRTKIWRLAERFAEFRAAPGPSLPAKVVRRSLALLYRDKSDPEVDEL
ncbi:MAG TPA: glycosyltransferase, partial [Anaeromyxobacteraceae bacterium]|nr:glycosyltransferase [Anaeromyxobacteraceae bacterium]